MTRSLFLAVLVSGCGARTAPVDDDAGLCIADSTGTIRVTQICGRDTCTLTGRDAAGTDHSFDCGPTGCTWSVAGTPACDCVTRDPANTCGNGVPFCVEWVPLVDFTAVGPCGVIPLGR